MNAMRPRRPTRTGIRVDPRTRKAFQSSLIRWFLRHRRRLPWRERRTPYRVWISELMLQQTRAEQAAPYFRRFVRRFPSVRALASAPRGAVLKMWEGLGYYARARNAHDAAKCLVDRHGGVFPRTREGLLALPGIGAYTASAVGSLAFGLDLAVVDGNVIRVLSRVMGYGGDVSSAAAQRTFRAWAQALLVPGKAGLSNESLMELGALVCTPRHPACARCPLRRVCAALAGGQPERFPVRRAKRRVPHKVVGAGVIVDGAGRVLIAQRKETSMLGGLWEFPGGTRERGESMPECIRRELREELGITVRVGPELLVVHHAYSHFTIDLHTHWGRMVRGRPRAIHCADFAWVPVSKLRRYPFSRADLHIVQCLEKWRGSFPGVGKEG